MKPCQICGSNEIYQYKDYFQPTRNAETMLPGLGVLPLPKIRTVVCQSCGHVRIFASEDARKKLSASKDWKIV